MDKNKALFFEKDKKLAPSPLVPKVPGTIQSSRSNYSKYKNKIEGFDENEVKEIFFEGRQIKFVIKQ